MAHISNSVSTHRFEPWEDGCQTESPSYMGHSPSVAASNAGIFTDRQNPQSHDFDWPFAAPATSIKNAVAIHPLLILLGMCSLLQRENELPNPLRRTYLLRFALRSFQAT